MCFILDTLWLSIEARYILIQPLLLFITAPLEDARFRKLERIIFKAHFFINGYSLKNKCNDEYGLLRFPQRAGL
ncbi:hypothetical protein CXF71_06880 [Colwellia sp. 12G3]|nr:hypothetical protein CXF71_06880 [Colwellia sp. 12G3]